MHTNCFYFKIAVIDLPRQMLYPKMLPTPSGNGVFIFDEEDMYELVCNTKGCVWKEKPKKLEIDPEIMAIRDHIVMYIPDNLSNCPVSNNSAISASSGSDQTHETMDQTSFVNKEFWLR